MSATVGNIPVLAKFLKAMHFHAFISMDRLTLHLTFGDKVYELKKYTTDDSDGGKKTRFCPEETIH